MSFETQMTCAERLIDNCSGQRTISVTGIILLEFTQIAFKRLKSGCTAPA